VEFTPPLVWARQKYPECPETSPTLNVPKPPDDGGFNDGSLLFLGTDASDNGIYGVYGYHAWSTVGDYTITTAVYNIAGTSSIESTAISVYTQSQAADLVAFNHNVVLAFELKRTTTVCS
jgi:hypothetical protein